MKQAELPEITERIAALAKSSALGKRIQKVEVEPAEYEDGAPYLRVYLTFNRTNDLTWRKLEPLVTSIEDSVEEIDDRYPSVRLADAA